MPLLSFFSYSTQSIGETGAIYKLRMDMEGEEYDNEVID